MSRGGRDPRGRALWGVASALAVVYALTPLAWLVSLSLKRSGDLADRRFVPQAVSLESYRRLFDDDRFLSALVNSVGVASLTTALAVALASAAAYAIARLDVPGGRAILAGSLAVAMFPPISVVGPLFDLWRLIGLYDTWTGLVVPYMTFALPLALWILTAFFRQIPWELEGAARLDGATRLQAFRRVVLPLAAPAMVTTAILVFVFAWNEFLFALSLTSTDRARTVPAALAFFAGESRFEQPTGTIAAAAVVVTVPVTAVVLLFQRRIVAGLTAGAVKG